MGVVRVIAHTVRYLNAKNVDRFYTKNGYGAVATNATPPLRKDCALSLCCIVEETSSSMKQSNKRSSSLIKSLLSLAALARAKNFRFLSLHVYAHFFFYYCLPLFIVWYLLYFSLSGGALFFIHYRYVFKSRKRPRLYNTLLLFHFLKICYSFFFEILYTYRP